MSNTKISQIKKVRSRIFAGKKIILALTIVITGKSFAQMSCCSKPGSTETFAMLTKDKKFIASHEEPIPFILANPIGKNISYKTPDGKEGYGYEIRSAKSSGKFLFVFQEWWGLNDYIRQESDKLYGSLDNVTVIAIVL